MTQAGLFPAEPTPPQPAGPGRIQIDWEYENRSTLTKASGFIQDYDYTLNPYSGCAFGCGYCYAAAFVSEKPDKDGNPSPYRRKNWGDWVRIKKNAVKQIAKAVHDNKLGRVHIKRGGATAQSCKPTGQSPDTSDPACRSG